MCQASESIDCDPDRTAPQGSNLDITLHAVTPLPIQLPKQINQTLKFRF